MADIQLAHPIDPSDWADIAIRQAVSCVQRQTPLDDARRAVHQFVEFCLLRLAVRRQRVLTRVEFDGIAADRSSSLLKQAFLSDWRAEIALLYDGRPRREATAALLEPVQRYGLLCDDFLTIVNGLEMEIRTAAEMASPAEFDLHGARAIIAVSRLATRILGLEESVAARFAAALGGQIDHVIAGASHFLQEDAGLEIGRLIAEWLGSDPRG